MNDDIQTSIDMLTRYIIVQCKKSMKKNYVDNTRIHQQQTYEGYNDIRNMISKLALKLHLQSMQVIQVIRIMEKYAQNKKIQLTFNTYYRILIGIVNLLNKFYNDRYLWLHSIQTMTTIDMQTMLQLELSISVAIGFDFIYKPERYEVDLIRIRQYLSDNQQYL